MIIKTVLNTWFQETGLRLDCAPYATGALEAKQALRDLDSECDHLGDLTLGYKGGIYNGPVFKRNYVQHKEYGVKFLTTSSMIQARLHRVSYLRKEDAFSKKLAYLELKKGMTMISCSGTIGRMVYTRRTMNGTWSCQDMLKVVCDPDKIQSGYAYAFLASKFGVPIITSSTYGAIIPHIEPEHIANLPIPRFSQTLENRIHQKVDLASEYRSDSEELLEQAGSEVNAKFGFPNKLAISHRIFSHSSASSKLVQKRMESTYHDGIAQESDRLVESTGAKKTLSELGVTTGESGRMKLIFTESDHGVPFSTSGEIFRARYEPKRFLAKSKVGNIADWGVQKEDLLLARSGQVGGIIGTGVWADSRFKDAAVSVDVIRIKAQKSKVLPGYLYAYLMCTDVGYRQLIRTAAGSSIPHLSSDDVLKLKLPRMGDDEEKSIHEMVSKAGKLAAEAQRLEDEAVKMVEDAIEAAAPKH
ncbi:methylation-associated defense system restriction endonuclease subunit S MAD5 [Vibrio cyclitrophicus]|nr:restriction endonuclease subunit S [Vibrio cyclitrophicus]PMH23418.1 restriction endonuclease subunit S [Vibrio cyclitrophicus]